MSERNVEMVRAGFQAYADRDLDALMGNFADDVEWRLIGGFADLMGEEFKGQAALRRFFVDWVANLGGSGEVETVLEAGEKVVAVVRTMGAGGSSGAPAEMRWGQVYTFRDGLIASVDNYYEPNEALAAVGLTE